MEYLCQERSDSMKYLVSPSKKEDIKELIDLNINSFLFGIKELSIYQNFYITIDELKEIIDVNDIEVFISLNKLMHNNDLVLLEQVLIELSKMPITGVLYDDMAIPSINEKLLLNLPLIWSGSHLVTNYNTINTLNVKGALLSSEITLDEMINIKKNTNKIIIVPVFGYQVMTTSKRNLVSNYLSFIGKEKENNIYYLKDKDGIYPTYEDANGAHILTKDVLNGIKELSIFENNDIDYVYLSSLNIESEVFNEVIKRYQNNIPINDLIANESTMFYYKETYFKVNNND